jgi:hypothetical protein
MADQNHPLSLENGQHLGPETVFFSAAELGLFFGWLKIRLVQNNPGFQFPREK